MDWDEWLAMYVITGRTCFFEMWCNIYMAQHVRHKSKRGRSKRKSRRTGGLHSLCDEVLKRRFYELSPSEKRKFVVCKEAQNMRVS